MSSQKIIVKVGADGGGDLTLYGVRTSNGWSFSMNIYDCTPLLLDEDEGGAAIQERSSPTNSWVDAMTRIDKYLGQNFIRLMFTRSSVNRFGAKFNSGYTTMADGYALDDWRRICE